MKSGTKEFSKAASQSYQVITTAEKEELRRRCNEHDQTKHLTAKNIKQSGPKIFKNIGNRYNYKYKILKWYCISHFHNI